MVEAVSNRAPIGEEVEVWRVANEHFKWALVHEPNRSLGELFVEAFGCEPQWTPEQVKAFRKNHA